VAPHAEEALDEGPQALIGEIVERMARLDRMLMLPDPE